VSKRYIFLIVIGIIIIGGAWWYFVQGASTTHTVKPLVSTSQPSKKVVTAESFNKSQYSLTDPNSIWVIVNKQHPIQPINFVPSDLVFPNVTLRIPGQTEMMMRSVAATALEQFFAGAVAAGYKLEISTAYRSYDYQQILYDNYVSTAGQAAADMESARPGYSEHQTGLAVDIRTQSNQCSLEACFGSLPEGQWLAANAYKYGFIQRYPANKVAITGYEYEPWHFRYIGTELSQEMYKEHVETLEEFFGVTGGTKYN
jgi:D-alanyl-D-alanine carboxypeptidase